MPIEFCTEFQVFTLSLYPISPESRQLKLPSSRFFSRLPALNENPESQLLATFNQRIKPMYMHTRNQPLQYNNIKIIIITFIENKAREQAHLFYILHLLT